MKIIGFFNVFEISETNGSLFFHENYWVFFNVFEKSETNGSLFFHENYWVFLMFLKYLKPMVL
jgi:hypothetical protein